MYSAGGHPRESWSLVPLLGTEGILSGLVSRFLAILSAKGSATLVTLNHLYNTKSVFVLLHAFSRNWDITPEKSKLQGLYNVALTKNHRNFRSYLPLDILFIPTWILRAPIVRSVRTSQSLRESTLAMIRHMFYPSVNSFEQIYILIFLGLMGNSC